MDILKRGFSQLAAALTVAPLSGYGISYYGSGPGQFNRPRHSQHPIKSKFDHRAARRKAKAKAKQRRRCVA